MTMNEDVIDPKALVAALSEQDKIKAALMYLVLRHGQQAGHWSGRIETLADALWNEHEGLYGADLDVDMLALAPVFEWCGLNMELNDGRLRITVFNTVV